MTYEKELALYLKNTFDLLEVDYGDLNYNNNTLNLTSVEFSKSKNPNEKILSIIIFHQSIIEMMRRLIVYSNFLSKLLIFPNQIKFKKIKDDDSFAFVYKELDFNVSFKNKNKLMQDIQVLNKIRNEISHRIDSNYYYYDDKDFFPLINSILNSFFEGIHDLSEKIKSAKQREELIKLSKKYHE